MASFSTRTAALQKKYYDGTLTDISRASGLDVEI